MGRKSNKKRQAGGDVEKKQLQKKYHRPNKRQKGERFWIEDCRPSSIPTTWGSKLSLEVLITQVQLYDDYRQVPQQPSSNEQIIEAKSAIPPEEAQADATTSPATYATIERKANEKEAKVEKADKDKKERDNEPKNDDSNGGEVVDDGANTPRKETTETESAEESANDRNHDNNEDEDAISKAYIAIKHSKSAMKPMVVSEDSVEHFKPLPNGDCGDGVTNPYPKEEVPDKFWSQRRRLFTLFDQGIRLDKESWYSVTPEAIANHIASHLAGSFDDAIVLDAFCGCGGNAIAFARMEQVKLVVCVDKDREKLKMAASNAAIYKIPPKKMVFIHDNAGRVLSLYENKKLQPVATNDEPLLETTSGGFKIGGIGSLPDAIDCIFLSPPWGGMDYGKVGKRNYTLRCITVDGIEETSPPMDGNEVLEKAAKALGNNGPIALFLPKNINGVSLGRSVLRSGYDCPMVMEKNVLNGKLKTVTAYIGL